MVKVMDGVRILEVAQFTFVPVAGAILADWGADVIKIEHPVRGDTQRGFINLEGTPVNPDRNVMMAHPNRGKRSVGIDVSTPEGQQLIYDLAKECDVFLTNYLPAQRQKLKIDVEHIRAANPNIIYARGSALGDKGPERLKGGFDSTAFWARGGSSMCITPPELGGPLTQPGPAYGDTIGGTNIAGGISAALFHRERTGEAVELDVSLLASGVWSVGMGLAMTMESGPMAPPRMPQSGGMKGNPFVGVFQTADGRHLNLTVLTPGPYLEDTWTHLDKPELMQDERFNTVEALMANWVEGSVEVTRAIASKPLSYWIDRFQTLRGQWAPYQSLEDVMKDPQVLANDIIVEVEATDGGAPIRLAAAPVQFNHEPSRPGRSPEASEHTEVVLMEFGIEWERIEQLKAIGAVA
ncbi:crotonobetainyl-CoA:carnitine CoA-transferase CaiB-like acyl-CoA transferase [Sphingobium sp. OAS761]|uniref:CaiB/BaiF CoA transferase family protein n=1 Tax=Sphingobium sp. OAS761 TaxID=2817901 RepID=UPI0020A0A592|nr:CoA transferase [Sphingobium sp. OAS761]MCP1471258.1 crotonobetainyl-CoA:carnitine CoA-transferase CaiB-like acyl-CoA transferase [Sphingobium sp. OAS761]